MSILRIYDIMPFLHTGSYHGIETFTGRTTNANRLKQWETPQIEAGGIRLLIDRILKNSTDKIIFTCDSDHYFKKDKYPFYKAGRKSNDRTRSVNKQKNLACVMLKDCGFMNILEHGYEGDDGMFSYINQHSDNHSRIFIHTDDNDLCFMVNKKVSLIRVRSNVKDVTRDTFEDTVRIESRPVPYNLSLIMKAVYGDTSDSVQSPFSNSEAGYLLSYFKENFMWNVLGSKEYLEQVASSWTSRESLRQRFLTMLDIIHPWEFDTESEFGVPNFDRLREWGRHIGMHTCGPGQISDRILKVVDKSIEEGEFEWS